MSQAAGIRLDETMSGGFALGETDPAQGQREGHLCGSALTLYNHITIADPEAFYADPDHPAALEVEVDFTPLGAGLRGTGEFNLFKPSSEPGLKLMVYRFGFEHDGAPYYFAGRKYIHDGSSITALWDETTHLYSRIHEGSDEEGPVVAAGVVSIGVWQVIEMVRSMSVINADSTIEQAETLARFGSFFFGALWDAYRKHLFGGASS